VIGYLHNLQGILQATISAAVVFQHTSRISPEMTERIEAINVLE
jgi:hypothetical protein